ncbi:MAG: ribosome recycling factor [Treponema sp.]|jgi:ribosome recycling factor|nr:ribosome recycling factor [Treponema sp.]
MSTVITDAEERMKKSLASLKDGFSAIRTGRASAALFDKIRVDYYGEKSPLSQVANISIPEARLVVIQPWDKALIGEIEKAIRSSELSLNPSNDGKVIRISIPPLTEERRGELVKLAKNQAEQSRVALRNIRRDGNEELKSLQKKGELTEDGEKQAETELQKLTDNYIAKINQALAEKEKEITEN